MIKSFKHVQNTEQPALQDKIETMWFLCAFPHCTDLMSLYSLNVNAEVKCELGYKANQQQHNQQTKQTKDGTTQMKMQTMIMYHLFNDTTRSCRSVRKI